MEPPILSAGFMLGIAIGFVTGMAFAVARRAWQDYRDTKAKVPVLRRLAWMLTAAATWRIAAALAIAVMVAVSYKP